MTSGTLASVTEYSAKAYHPGREYVDGVAIEVLSKDDSVVQMKRRVDDYLSFGVSYVWLIDPRERRAWSCTGQGTVEAGGALRTSSPEIRVPLADIFSSL